DAIESVAVDDGSGNLQIPRTALHDAIFATSGYQGVTGTITCTPLGDCATDVTIGIFQAPDWPVEGGNPDAEVAFSETKTLEDVSAETAPRYPGGRPPRSADRGNALGSSNAHGPSLDDHADASATPAAEPLRAGTRV